MTRTNLVSLVFFSASSLFALGCKSDPASTDTSTTTAAATVTAEPVDELAKINALVPKELQSSLVFEKVTFHGDANGDGSVYRDEKVTAYRPKGWRSEPEKNRPEGLFQEPVSADADVFAEVGRASLLISTECDGACVPKDWTALATKRIEGSLPLGPGVHDEILPHNGRIRWGVTPDDAMFYRASVYAAWTTEGANVMRTCEVTLQDKKWVAALDAFAEACKVSQAF